MIPGSFLGLLPFVLGIFAGQPGLIGQSVSRIAFQDTIILRVPVLPRPPLPRIEWREHKGPKCVPLELVQRAVLSDEDDKVDFIMANHVRMRATLDEDCPALDFYNGFYLQTPDERLCAGRDEIHSRMGGSCRIERFRQLTPKVR
jgi:hypothetical protein